MVCDALVASLLGIVTGGYGDVVGYFSLAINLGVFMVLAMWLFDLDGMEAFVMWLMVFLVPNLLLIIIGLTILNMFL